LAHAATSGSCRVGAELAGRNSSSGPRGVTPEPGGLGGGTDGEKAGRGVAGRLLAPVAGGAVLSSVGGSLLEAAIGDEARDTAQQLTPLHFGQPVRQTAPTPS